MNTATITGPSIKAIEFDDGRCFPPMGRLTLKQGASLVTTTNYLVATENGVTRALTKEEEKELRGYRKAA